MASASPTTSLTSSHQKRALVIGNNNYKNALKLQCCTNDAKDMKNVLESIHFNVIIGTDLTYDKMTQKISHFVHGIQRDDLLIVFFAGHGTQWNDQNFLIPVDDDKILDPEMVKQRAIRGHSEIT